MRNLLLFVALLLGCSGDFQPAVKVNVSRVPDGALFLTATAHLGTQALVPAGQSQSSSTGWAVAQGLESKVVGGATSFGLFLDPGLNGTLSVGVEVWDREGHCIMGNGVGSLTIDMLTEGTISVALTTIDLVSCLNRLPLVSKVDPQWVYTMGPNVPIHITGAGFLPNTQVSVVINGTSRRATVVSGTATDLMVQMPSAPGTLGPHTLLVSNPDGSQDSKKTVNYRTRALSFEANVFKANSSQTINLLTLANLSGHHGLDIVAGVTMGSGFVLVNHDYPEFINTPYQIGDTGVPYASLAAGNFLENQGVLDVAVGTTTGFVLLKGKGNGSFGIGPSYPEPIPEMSPVNSLSTGDINGDMRIDIVENLVDGTTNIYLNQSTGVFAISNGRLPIAGASGPTAIVDMNGDGRNDLVTNTPKIFLQDSTGSFNPFLGNYSVGGVSDCIAVQDINQDGLPDVIVADDNYSDIKKSNGNVWVFINQGKSLNTGLWNGLPTYEYPKKNPPSPYPTADYYEVGMYPRCAAVADLDGDGTPDIAVSNQNSNNVSVLLNSGNGKFTPNPPTWAVGPVDGGPYRPNYAAIGDIDGDGRLDIVTANLGGDVGHSSITILHNISQ